MQADEILRDSLALLRHKPIGQGLMENSWCKGVFTTGSQYCAMGAMNKVTTGYAVNFGELLHQDAAEALALVIWEQFSDRAPNSFCWATAIPVFNNHADTTFEDIELVFEKAILRAEEVSL